MLERRVYTLVTYRKTGLLRFLGHLDIARAMDRAIRRAKLPVEYSQGFSPHARLSFSAPLPVGVAGEAELMALDLTAEWSAEAVAKSLTRQLPWNLGIVAAQVLRRPKRSPFSDLVAADYRADVVHCEQEPLAAAIASLLAAPTLTITRSTKSRVVEVDIRERIIDLALIPGGGVWMRLGMTDEDLVKPAEVLGLLAQALGQDLPAHCLTRTALWFARRVGEPDRNLPA
jgi:radical SAM-linked protein